jgi:hypothetical protein
VKRAKQTDRDLNVSQRDAPVDECPKLVQRSLATEPTSHVDSGGQHSHSAVAPPAN